MDEEVAHYVASKPVSSICYSQDGKYLAIGERGNCPMIYIWDTSEKALLFSLTGHSHGISCMSFSKDSKYLVSCGYRNDHFIYVWDIEKQQKYACAYLSNKSYKMYDVTWNSDNLSFAVCGEKFVKFYYLSTVNKDHGKSMDGIPLIECKNGKMDRFGEGIFTSLCYGSGDMNKNTLYVCSNEGKLCQFTSTLIMERWVDTMKGDILSIDINGEYIIIGHINGYILLINQISLECKLVLPFPLAIQEMTDLNCNIIGEKNEEYTYPAVLSLYISNDSSTVYVLYSDHSIYVWNIANLDKIGLHCTLFSHNDAIWDMKIPNNNNNNINTVNTDVIPPNTIVTCSSDNTIRMWSIDNSNTIAKDKVYQSRWTSLYSRDLLKLIGINEQLPINNIINQTFDPEIIPTSKTGVRSISFHPTNQYLAAGDREGNIYIYSMNTFKLIKKYQAHTTEILGMEYSPILPLSDNNTSLLASCGRDRLIHIFDSVDDHKYIQTIDNHTSAITCVRFSNNGKYFITASSDKYIIVSEVVGKKIVKPISHTARGSIYDIAVEPTNKFFVTVGQDKTIGIWFLNGGKPFRTYRPDDIQELYRVKVDPSGLFIAVCSYDKTIRLFDLMTGEIMGKVSGHGEKAISLSFSQNGKKLITCAGDGTIFIWKLPSSITKSIKIRRKEMESEMKVAQQKQQQQPISIPPSISLSDTSPSLDLLSNSPSPLLLQQQQQSSSAGAGAGSAPPPLPLPQPTNTPAITKTNNNNNNNNKQLPLPLLNTKPVPLASKINNNNNKDNNATLLLNNNDMNDLLDPPNRKINNNNNNNNKDPIQEKIINDALNNTNKPPNILEYRPINNPVLDDTTPLWARSNVNVKSSEIEQKSVLSSVDPSKIVPIQPKKLTDDDDDKEDNYQLNNNNNNNIKVSKNHSSIDYKVTISENKNNNNNNNIISTDDNDVDDSFAIPNIINNNNNNNININDSIHKEDILISNDNNDDDNNDNINDDIDGGRECLTNTYRKLTIHGCLNAIENARNQLGNLGIMLDPQQAQQPKSDVKIQQKSPFIKPSKPSSSPSSSPLINAAAPAGANPPPPLPTTTTTANSSISAPVEALRSSIENLKKVFKETMDLYKEVENASRTVNDLNESSILNDSLSSAMNDLADIKNGMSSILPDIELDNPQTNQLLEKYSQLLINAVLNKK